MAIRNGRGTATRSGRSTIIIKSRPTGAKEQDSQLRAVLRSREIAGSPLPSRPFFAIAIGHDGGRQSDASNCADFAGAAMPQPPLIYCAIKHWIGGLRAADGSDRRG